ncbi:MAG TPA: sensor domain-containing diguanylate cyclase [Burkholderiaceae bacterium]|jgi:diguanylate cyclase (GGDEF)-like protein
MPVSLEELAPLATAGSLPRRPAAVLRQRLARAWHWTRRWTMVLVVAALLCWLWAMFFIFSAQQKQQLLEDRTNELSLMASAAAQHSSGLLASIETELHTLDTWLVTHPGADPLRDSRFLALVDEMRRSSGGLTDFRMLSEAGEVYYLSASDGRPRANVTDREYFSFHAAGPGAQPRSLHVSVPVLSRVDRRWYLPISMKLSTPLDAAEPSPRRAAMPMRVLYAAVGLERLAGEHENMRFRPDGAITLVRSDGIILSRAPIDSPFIGRDLSKSRHFEADYGPNPRGSFVSEGLLTDHVKRLVTFEHLREYPVTVLVSRSYDDVFAAFDARQRTATALNAVLTVIVIVVTAIFVLSRRAQHEMVLVQDDLRRLAATDELTGAMNRRAFMDGAKREFDRARRYDRPTAVLALDIDHFKLVNDDYGHASGDLVLRGCVARWQAALRDQDFLGRIGGEEFCIVLPETSDTHAALIAERLRALTGDAPMLDGRCLVTVSVGWTVIEPADKSWADVMERADRALYAAKAAGRNCISPTREQRSAAATSRPQLVSV